MNQKSPPVPKKNQRPVPNSKTAMSRMSAPDRAALIASRLNPNRKSRFPSGDFDG